MISSLLFFGAVIAAAVAHPAIGEVLLVLMVGLPITGLVLGSLARSRAGASNPLTRRRARRAMILAGVELTLCIVIAILLPGLCRSTEQGNRIKCASNLKMIGIALAQYAEENGGNLPPSLDVLVTGKTELQPAALVCPSSNDEPARGASQAEVGKSLATEPHHDSYIYVGSGLTTATIKPEHVIAYEPTANHLEKGMNVLFGDWHVEWLVEKSAQTLLAELKAGHNPPSEAEKIKDDSVR